MPTASDPPPLGHAIQTVRRHLGVRGELTLAVLPTTTVLLVMALVDALSAQRLLFASLASSAFLIYLDPTHVTNQVRTLALAQLSAAAIGWAAYAVAGPGYPAAGSAMVASIVGMIAVRAVHPPAVSTAMSFGLRAGDVSDLLLFSLSLGVLAILVFLQRSAAWTMLRLAQRMRARRQRE